jgi:mono/diheme cytochrome c family protein
MQRCGLGLVVMWWTLLGMALAAEQQQQSPGEVVRVGHHYFVRYCSACHGVEGRGDGPAASALRTPPADLTRIAQRRGGISVTRHGGERRTRCSLIICPPV